MFEWLKLTLARRGEIYFPRYLVRRDHDGLKFIAPDRTGTIQCKNWTLLRAEWGVAGGVVRPYRG